MSQPTPGPWTVGKLSDGGYSVSGPDEPRFDRPWEKVSYAVVDRVPKVEDARLIAHAPALREALSNFVEMYVKLVNSGDCGSWDPETDKEVIEARALLKAIDG